MWAEVAGAANHFVLSSATGANNGSSWTDAFTALPASLTANDTYFVGAGTYAGWNITANGVTIQHPTVASHGTPTGWVDAFTNQTLISSGFIWINANNVTIDGATGGGPGAWTTGFGIKVVTPKTGYPNPTVFFGQNQAAHSNATVRHIEVEGNHGDTSTGGLGNSTVGIYWNNPIFTMYYVYLHDAGECLVFGRSGNLNMQFIYGGTYISSPAQHAEMMSLVANDQGTGGSLQNIIIGNSIFTHCEGTGGLMMQVTGAQIFGNVFYHATADNTWNYCGGGSGMIGGKDSGEVMQNVRIYNNTFIDTTRNSCGGANSQSALGFYLSTGNNPGNTGNVAYNNIFMLDTIPGTQNVNTHDYNEFISVPPTPPAEAHGVTTTGTIASIFNNATGLDFTLINNTTAGNTLDNTFTNVDPNGVTRSTWTRGAYEFAGTPPTPVAPTINIQPTAQNLQVSQTINLTVSASGTAPLFYQWKKGTTTVSGSTIANYTKANAQVADSGTYSVVITNSAGTVTSSSVAVSVTNPAVALIGISTGSLAFGIIPTNTVGLLSFNVSNRGSGTLAGTASASAPFAIVGTATYSLAAGSSQTITVSYTPTSVATNGDTVALTGGGGTNVSVTGLGYSIQAISGISMGGAVVVPPTVLTGGTILDSVTNYTVFNQGYAVVGFSLPNAVTNISMSALVIATNVSNNSVWINVDATPLDPANIWDVTSLTGNSLVSRPVGWRGNGSDTSPQFATNIWSLGSGPHYVIIYPREPFMQVGTLTSQTYAVPPLITTQPQSQNVFSGTPVSFIVGASGTAPLSYQWNFNSVPIGGANASFYAIASPLPANSGQYFCTVTNVAGSLNSFAATLNVTDPIVPVQGPSNLVIYIGSPP